VQAAREGVGAIIEFPDCRKDPFPGLPPDFVAATVEDPGNRGDGNFGPGGNILYFGQDFLPSIDGKRLQYLKKNFAGCQDFLRALQSVLFRGKGLGAG